VCFAGAADVKEVRVERARKASAAVDQRENGRGEGDVEWDDIVISGGGGSSCIFDKKKGGEKNRMGEEII
jgi:hypothetical protein